ncbi:hypothetical protein BH11PAT1_BH11PAT1_7600 [soil metagenome]
MNVIQLLRDQVKSAHDTLEATMGDVTQDVAHFTETGKALPVGAAYAHVIMSEDMIVSHVLAHKPAEYENDDTGLSEPMPAFGASEWTKHEQWARTVKIDLPKLKAFSQKVFAATDAYIASLSEEDLEKEIDVQGMGKNTIVFFITNAIILHCASLTGEISAAKGIQNLKGYPF